MANVARVELELLGEAGSRADMGRSAGLGCPALCSGIFIELAVVAARGEEPCGVVLHDLQLASHAPIEGSLRVVARAFDRWLEVVSALPGSPASLAATQLVADVRAGAITLPQLELPSDAEWKRDDALCYALRSAVGPETGAAEGFVLVDEAHVLHDGVCARATLDARALLEPEAYALHPLLWEAGLSLARALLAASGPGVARDPQRSAMRAERFAIAATSAIPCAVIARVRSSGSGAAPTCDLSWLAPDGEPVAWLGGFELDAASDRNREQNLASARIAHVIEDTLGKRVQTPEQPFAELGMSSLDRTRFAAALAHEMGVRPSLAELLACACVADLARVLGDPLRVQAHADAEHDERSSAARATADGPWPLTPAQREVWALQATSPASARCHIHVALRCDRPLPLESLQSALDALVERHAALRTVFTREGDSIMQHVRPPSPVALAVHDLRALPASEREAAAAQRAEQQAMQPFDLAAGPLVRFTWLRAGEGADRLVVTLHHLVVDGFSVELLVRDLGRLLAGVALREAPPHAHVLGGLLDAHSAAAATPATGGTRLPLARDPDGSPPGRGAHVPVALSAHARRRLRQLAAREQVTLFALLTAAYAEVLAQHVGAREVVLGVVTSGRAQLDQLEAVGLFARGVPLTLQLDDDCSLLDLAREVEARVAQATNGSQAQVGPEYAAGGLRPSATVLFQSWSRRLHVTPTLGFTLELDALDGAPRGTCRSELELLAGDVDGELHAGLTYDVSVFAAQTVEWLASALRDLLEAAAAQPRAGLTALIGRDARPSLEPWNDTASAWDPQQHVGARVAHAATQWPDDVACRDARGAVLCYRELSERVQAVARALRARGVERGDYVGVLAERNVDLPVAVLGVLTAGAAYVPIDPHHPRARIAAVLDDTHVRVLLVPGERTREHADLLPQLASWTVAELVATAPAALGEDRSEPARHEPSDAAYVLHTSGSTGRPKGVLVEHRNLTSFLHGMDTLLAGVPRTQFLALTTLAFDISIVELLWPLTRGFEVFVGPSPDVRAMHAAPFARVRAASRDGACFQCTPSLARLLLDDPDGRTLLGRLRVLLIGGESLPTWLGRALCEVVPGAVWNVYGPTETTVWSSAWRVESPVRTCFIGRPLANQSFHVLDAHGRNVPHGLAGELWIGGAGVARGYLGRPQETAERFVAGTCDATRSRMYRTGDCVRVRAGGVFEWLGRLDRQVKLAGNRIELSEIEGALAAHPEVRECAVVVHVEHGLAQLVAHVVPRQSSALTPAVAAQVALREQLLAWLGTQLPAYMLPARFAWAEILPRTASGKTDHQALAAQRLEHSVGADTRNEPQTPNERALAALWQQVLGVQHVARDDDFFALGGTSMAAVQLAAQAERSGYALTPATVLAHPTLCDQAEALTSRDAAAVLDLPSEIEACMPQLQPATTPARTPARVFVLTGATGFLGAHLLAELAARTDVEVVCLVRAASDADAERRVLETLEHWRLEAALVRTRCIAADLTRPRAGLDARTWHELAQRADAIVHNAAEVSFAAGYAQLRAPNVESTASLLELAALGVRKTFHYVSTVAIADAASGPESPTEETPLRAWQQLRDGYCQSKWVAEGLVRRAAAQGVGARIYRAGILVGRAGAAISPHDDAFVDALVFAAQSHVSFATAGRFVAHLSAVDETARAIVTLACEPVDGCHVEHVANPQRIELSAILDWLRAEGIAVQELPDAEWLTAVASQLERSPALFVTAERIRSGTPLLVPMDCHATDQRLRERGVALRPLTAEHLVSLLRARTA